jgi:hypothetical protein
MFLVASFLVVSTIYVLGTFAMKYTGREIFLSSADRAAAVH